jgi:antirestriction protein ArdC
MAKFDLYEAVTERIIAQLEAGVVPWHKPWRGSAAINYVSRKAYRGINTLLLPQGGEYLTFKQALDVGGNVRKGEKSSIVIFYKLLNSNSDSNADADADDSTTERFYSGRQGTNRTRLHVTYATEHCVECVTANRNSGRKPAA